MSEQQITEQSEDVEQDVEAAEHEETSSSADEQDVEETFPREYVEELRQENGKYRQRAQRADDLAHRLHAALVAATDRLADPEDLDFNEEHLEDPEALTAALDGLLERKPHLASRRPRGDVGQGHTSAGSVDLAGLLRVRAN